MRVLSVLHYASWGGPLNRNSRVAPLLEKRGIHTTVLLPDEPGDGAARLRQSGLNVIQISLSRLRNTYRPIVQARYLAGIAGEVRNIRRILRESKIDLVQVNGFGNPQAAFAAKAERLPVVWQLLDVGYPPVIRKVGMVLVVRMANVLMTTGIKVAQAHPGAMSFGDRLVSFFPPVDVSRFKPDHELRRAARLELGLGTEDLVIGTVGNINLQKDHPTFVRAAAELKRKIPKARFVILGATLPNRVQLAEELNWCAQNLGFHLGHDLIVKNPESRVWVLEQAFDIFWLTSRWEGIPTVVEEAMALGLPVVSMDVGAVGEAVENGVNGFLVPARAIEAMLSATLPLIENPELRTAIGQRARQHAIRTFDVNICADVHARAFEIAMSMSRKQAAFA
jgi:glycosyltransferase involved in cell wall biosynthesis